MHKPKRPSAAWGVAWQQVEHRDRDERLQRALALSLPQAEARVRHPNREQHQAPRRRPGRQSLQGSSRRGRHQRVPTRQLTCLARGTRRGSGGCRALSRGRVQWGHAGPPWFGCSARPGQGRRSRSGARPRSGPLRPPPGAATPPYGGMATLGGEIGLLQRPMAHAPEEPRLLQRQGGLAEGAREHILARSRRGKRPHAQPGPVRVVASAPSGEVDRRAGDTGQARYAVHPPAAAPLRRMVTLDGEEGRRLGALARPRSAEQRPTRRGAPQWERSVGGGGGATRRLGGRRPRANPKPWLENARRHAPARITTPPKRSMRVPARGLRRTGSASPSPGSWHRAGWREPGGRGRPTKGDRPASTPALRIGCVVDSGGRAVATRSRAHQCPMPQTHAVTIAVWGKMATAGRRAESGQGLLAAWPSETHGCGSKRRSASQTRKASGTKTVDASSISNEAPALLPLFL
jgi:hypothetical protein